MRLRTIATGSSGNCYLLEAKEGSLLIEAGIPINKIKKALDYDFSDIQGCLVTHEHMDHAKAVNDIASLGINIYGSKGTFKALGCTGYRFIPLTPKKPKTIGKFEVLPFKVEHDALEPLGFLIRQGKRRMLFVTDTFYLRYRFKGLTHIAIECNYSEQILKERVEEGEVHLKHAQRVMKSHFSLENVIKFLKVNDLSKVKEITLIHLSNENSDVKLFRREIEEVYGGKLVIAGGD